MSMEAAVTAGALSPFEQLRFARQVILTESRALAEVAKRLDSEFCRTVRHDPALPGQRAGLRHRQGGTRGPENHGHLGLDRYAQPLLAPRGGGPR